MPLIEVALPADMHEIISAGKYPDMIRVLSNTYKNQATARLAMLQALTGFNGFDLGIELGAPRPVDRNRSAESIDEYDAAEITDKLFPELDFIFNNEPFYTNPIKQFTHNGIRYEGPDDKLLNQTGVEWTISHHAQIMYQNTQEEKHLQTIIAANYHEVIDGTRSALDETAMDKKGFTALPPEIVRGIYIWYLHCEAWWNAKYVKLYLLDDKGSKPAKGKEVWDLIFELSGCQLGTNYDMVQTRTRQQIYLALDKLEQKRIAAEEQSKSS